MILLHILIVFKENIGIIVRSSLLSAAIDQTGSGGEGQRTRAAPVRVSLGTACLDEREWHGQRSRRHTAGDVGSLLKLPSQVKTE